ncbi:predicted protein [Histoplasma capsulatum H143]|uniref:Uncharacterized protein n=1 Tax=Ajellomyces capsulatus (strain H143) TaxID=544712 RepID=C6HH01_AJECH|nr:predicted protein [Histoplasma capsulatum H143]
MSQGITTYYSQKGIWVFLNYSVGTSPGGALEAGCFNPAASPTRRAYVPQNQQINRTEELTHWLIAHAHARGLGNRANYLALAGIRSLAAAAYVACGGVEQALDSQFDTSPPLEPKLHQHG